MLYFALIIMYYHVKISCYQLSYEIKTSSLVSFLFLSFLVLDEVPKSGKNVIKAEHF